MITDADKRIQTGIIGSALNSPDSRTGADQLSAVPERWFTASHLAAVRAIILAAGGMDVFGLQTKLMADGSYEQLGGAALIADFTATLASTESGHQWSMEELRNSYVRHHIDLLTDTIKNATQGGLKADERLQMIEGAVTKIRQGSEAGNQSFGHIREAIDRLSDSISEAQDDLQEGKHTFAIPTGIELLDKYLFAGGVRAGQLVLVAARPGKGKSSFMVSVAMNMALAGSRVGIISLEMTAEDLAEVGVQIVGNIAVREFYRRVMEHGESMRFTQTAGTVAEKAIWIDDSPRLTSEQVASRAAHMVREKGCQVVFLDYAQCVKLPGRGTRYEEMTAVSERLRECAKELRVPIVAMAQLNREAGEDARPKIEQIKETGQWEQDAHVVLMLHRPDANKPLKELANQPNEPMEIILGKQRRGAASMIIPATFNRETQRIS